MHNRFAKGSGRFVCAMCGKATRQTAVNAGTDYCPKCVTVLEYVNAIEDGSMTLEEVPVEHRQEVAKHV